MGPCVGCGRPARLSGLCAECRTANEVALRQTSEALIDRQWREEIRDRLAERRDEAS